MKKTVVTYVNPDPTGAQPKREIFRGEDIWIEGADGELVVKVIEGTEMVDARHEHSPSPFAHHPQPGVEKVQVPRVIKTVVYARGAWHMVESEIMNAEQEAAYMAEHTAPIVPDDISGLDDTPNNL